MPIFSAPSMMAAGGAAPAICPAMRWSMPRSSSSGALISMEYTIGAPHICVTWWSRIASSAAARHDADTWCRRARRSTRNQPLQWNIGSVHRHRVRRHIPVE
jgi:hypothetical protein